MYDDLIPSFDGNDLGFGDGLPEGFDGLEDRFLTLWMEGF